MALSTSSGAVARKLKIKRTPHLEVRPAEVHAKTPNTTFIQSLANHACELVLNRKLNEFKIMLDGTPEMLFERCHSITDAAGRQHEDKSAFQVALADDDLQKDIVDVMKAAIEKLPDGKQLAAQQALEQLPQLAQEFKLSSPPSNPVTRDLNNEKKSFFTRILSPVANAIDEDKSTKGNDKTAKALEQFRKDFEQEYKQYVKESGQHFNMAWIIAAHDFFPVWDEHQQNLFGQALSHIKRFFPANLALFYDQNVTRNAHTRKVELLDRTFAPKLEQFRELKTKAFDEFKTWVAPPAPNLVASNPDTSHRSTLRA